MEEDFSPWFRRMLSENELVDDRYDVKGMLVYRGNGMKIIKNMVSHLERLLEEDGHEPTLFPILIPETLLEKEKDHIAGFEEQVYWVTHAGKTPLDRKLALRPTSETIMYPMFALWVRTFQDLFIKVHQTCTVYRYETKQTRPLIRSREFYWNEGHTAFAKREELLENLNKVEEIYVDLISGLCCVPVQVNRRPEWDKFPGAEYTTAFETIMPDGKTLQVATIHNLGQHFSKVFNIVYDDEEGEKHHCYQSSYGPGFGRLLAAVVAVHGDEKGMIIPPMLAPTQAVIVPVVFKDKDKQEILEYVDKIAAKLKGEGIRHIVDAGDERPGAKYYKWERLGVPLRIEAGPRDLGEGKVVLVRRDTGEKSYAKLCELDVGEILDEIQDNLRKEAGDKFGRRLYTADTLVDLDEKLGEGVVTVGWCEADECAKSLDERGTILTILDQADECIVCGKKGKQIRIAKTY